MRSDEIYILLQQLDGNSLVYNSKENYFYLIPEFVFMFTQKESDDGNEWVDIDGEYTVNKLLDYADQRQQEIVFNADIKSIKSNLLTQILEKIGNEDSKNEIIKELNKMYTSELVSVTDVYIDKNPLQDSLEYGDIVRIFSTLDGKRIFLFSKKRIKYNKDIEINECIIQVSYAGYVKVKDETGEKLYKADYAICKYISGLIDKYKEDTTIELLDMTKEALKEA